MKKYDSIVVGGGICGMTMALLLARCGQKVLLLEKARRIGGSVNRFYRGGVPFDIGFHFTGGLSPRGLMHEMLAALGILDRVEPIFFSEDCAMRFILEDEGGVYDIPSGLGNVIERLKGYFPSEAGAVERFFDIMKGVCANTPSMSLENMFSFHQQLDEDFVTLDDVLCGLTGNVTLRGILSGCAMCYGSKPAEISMANHARMCLSFYESLAYVKKGGEAFVDAFRERFNELGVEVLTGRHIVELSDIKDQTVGRFVLDDGDEVSAANCIFTIHPFEIIRLLKGTKLTKAFLNRVAAYKPSVGFFTVFATLKGKKQETRDDSAIVSIFPHHDVNQLLDPQYTGRPAHVILRSIEPPLEGGIRPLHILEPACQSETSAWEGSSTGKRPGEYYDFKQNKTKEIIEHVLGSFPQYRNRIKVIDSSSMLTFRDYLNSPDGSAYGIRQQVGQFNLVGRLPLRNLHAAGQSAVLPGVVGAMMSSFIVAAGILGKDKFEGILGGLRTA